MSSLLLTVNSRNSVEINIILICFVLFVKCSVINELRIFIFLLNRLVNLLWHSFIVSLERQVLESILVHLEKLAAGQLSVFYVDNSLSFNAEVLHVLVTPNFEGLSVNLCKIDVLGSLVDLELVFNLGLFLDFVKLREHLVVHISHYSLHDVCEFKKHHLADIFFGVPAHQGFAAVKEIIIHEIRREILETEVRYTVGVRRLQVKVNLHFEEVTLLALSVRVNVDVELVGLLLDDGELLREDVAKRLNLLSL